jgi:uncharacterized repeat protein (TIGR01451 family)
MTIPFSIQRTSPVRSWLMRLTLSAALIGQLVWTSGVALASPGSTSSQTVSSVAVGPTTLAISKSASPNPVNQGSLLTYTIVVTNTGTNMASLVQITDTLPSGSVFESASVIDGGGATWLGGGPQVGGTGDFFWFTSDWLNLGGGLPAGNTAILQIIVKVVGPIQDQSFVSNDNYQVLASNAPLVGGATVNTVVNSPHFQIGKAASPDPVQAGALLQYTITLTNNGHLTTTLPYAVVEALPSYTQFASASGGSIFDPISKLITWTLNSPLSPGQNIVATFNVTVTSPLTDDLQRRSDADRLWRAADGDGT